MHLIVCMQLPCLAAKLLMEGAPVKLMDPSLTRSHQGIRKDTTPCPDLLGNHDKHLIKQSQVSGGVCSPQPARCRGPEQIVRRDTEPWGGAQGGRNDRDKGRGRGRGHPMGVVTLEGQEQLAALMSEGLGDHILLWRLFQVLVLLHHTLSARCWISPCAVTAFRSVQHLCLEGGRWCLTSPDKSNLCQLSLLSADGMSHCSSASAAFVPSPLLCARPRPHHEAAKHARSCTACMYRSSPSV